MASSSRGVRDNRPYQVYIKSESPRFQHFTGPETLSYHNDIIFNLTYFKFCLLFEYSHMLVPKISRQFLEEWPSQDTKTDLGQNLWNEYAIY